MPRMCWWAIPSVSPNSSLSLVCQVVLDCKLFLNCLITMPTTGSNRPVCLGIHRCNIEVCTECDAVFQAEVDKIEERSKRKAPPETWAEKSRKRDEKKQKKNLTEAVREAKRDVKRGRVGTMGDYFRTVKK